VNPGNVDLRPFCGNVLSTGVEDILGIGSLAEALGYVHQHGQDT